MVTVLTYSDNNIHCMNENDHMRSVVFDVDGTLFDTLPSLSAAANNVLAAAGMRQVSTSLLRPALNEGLRSMFRHAIALQSTPVDAIVANQLEGEYMAHYEERWLPAAPLYAGVAKALAALKSQGLRLGICTNRDRASTEALLAAASIADSFDAIVSLGDAPFPKPAPDPLLLLMELLQVPPAEALFVGDSGMDARCAQLSRVRFAAHLGGYAGQPGDLLPNVLSFTGYDQLTGWVLDRPAVLHLESAFRNQPSSLTQENS